MSDPIERQAAIDAIDILKRNYPSSCFEELCKAVDIAIKALSSAQLERKKGKWIYYPKASGSISSTAVHFFPVCSECGREHPISNYCPNCGAKMQEVEE